jgi:hypothetical protein
MLVAVGTKDKSRDESLNTEESIDSCRVNASQPREGMGGAMNCRSLGLPPQVEPGIG